MHARATLAWSSAVVLSLTAVAGSRAEPEHDPVKAGAQATGPGPAQPESPAPVYDESGRTAIRGCPSTGTCDDPMAGLVEFEHEAFPAPDASVPWRDDDAPADAMPRHRIDAKPTDLRPDLPWLADLELPDLPVHWDLRIIKFLEFYKDDPRGRRLMQSWLEAQGRYQELIAKELAAAKLPADLLYVAMIESSYDPLDTSTVGASGLWQFMPEGGKIYGLAQDRWVDERNDPVKATRAVTAYFADLYQRFGDWDLALAAFNAGYGAVLKSIAKYNTNDFWQLLEYENGLPWESSIYVPKALACAIVGHNRALFGYADVVAIPALRYDSVKVDKSTSLVAIAKAAGSTVDEIKRLNPQLRRARTPPGQADFVVRIPAGSADRFGQAIAQLRGDWDGYDAYVVRHGERFEDVATEFGISKQKLRELNGIASETEVHGGTILVVPVVAEADRKANLERAAASLYASGVGGGEPDDKLIVPLPDPTATVADKRRVFYRVVAGDGLIAVARAFGVDRAALAGWNGLNPEARLHPRMVLALWVAADFDPEAHHVALLDEAKLTVVKAGSEEHLALAEARIGRERIAYVAKKRETFEQIGRRFGLSSHDLARINKRPFDTTLAPGESCVVYQVVDRKASDRAAEQARSVGHDLRPGHVAAAARGKGRAKVKAKAASRPRHAASNAQPQK